MKVMKRLGNKFKEICSIENIERAAQKASKGKSTHRAVKWYKKRRCANNLALHLRLINKLYSVSEYEIFNKTTEGGKVREIHKLPFYPDRIVQHSVLNVMFSF